jgi:hypothetical protein
MKSGQEQIKTWFNRVRRIVVRAAHKTEECEVRWLPESFQAVQLEMEFTRETVREKFGVHA